MGVSINPLPSTRRPCLQEQTFLVLMKFGLSVFCLMAHAFGVTLRNF